MGGAGSPALTASPRLRSEVRFLHDRVDQLLETRYAQNVAGQLDFGLSDIPPQQNKMHHNASQAEGGVSPRS